MAFVVLGVQPAAVVAFGSTLEVQRWYLLLELVREDHLFDLLPGDPQFDLVDTVLPFGLVY